MLSRIRLMNLDERLIPEGSRDYVDLIHGSVYNRTGFDLRDAQGLGPVPSQINFSEFAMIPGGQFHSHNVQTRNIVLRIGFDSVYNTDMSVQDLRREIYQIASPGSNVRLRLYNNRSFEMQIDGWVETAEPVIFSKDPEIQISIICTHPFFREPGSSVFENLSWSHDFYYGGDIVYGYNIVATVLENINWLEIQDLSSIYDETNRPSMRINHPIPAGDKVRVITTPGNRQVTQMHPNESFKARLITHVHARAGGWPQMKPGNNTIGVRGNNPSTVEYNIGVVRRYGGF